MTKAELNAHWALPDETLGDSYGKDSDTAGWLKSLKERIKQ